MRIAIIGLGPAGLHAAVGLEERGYEVVAFEARNRVGGRLHTVAVEGGWYEAGGEWIDADHTRLLSSVQRWSGEATPDHQYPGTGHIRGQSFPEEAPPASGELGALDARLDLMALDLDPVPWMNALHRDLDRRTLKSFLDHEVKSVELREVLEAQCRSDEGEDSDQVSLLGHLYGRAQALAREGGEMSAHRFPMGAQRWCEAVAQQIRGPVHLQTPVRSVIDEGERVLIRTGDGDHLADRVVLAIPPPALRQIDVLPGLSPDKSSAIEEARMSRTIKISVECECAIWRERGINVRRVSDGAIQQCWDAGRDGAAVLNVYLNGHAAAEWVSSWGEAAKMRVVTALESLLDLPLQVRSVSLHPWIADPLAGGGFFVLTPGFMLDHWEALWRTEGRFHFAGDHVAKWSGFIEGALESAERVVQEIVDAENL